MNLSYALLIILTSLFIEFIALWAGWDEGRSLAAAQPPRACTIQEIVRELPGDYVAYDIGLRPGFFEAIRRPRWSGVSL